MKFEKYQVKVFENGDAIWYQNNTLHRVGGPAVICVNGDKFWYQNGLRHRIDGPAIEFVNGDKQYWIEGVQYTKAQFLAKVSPPASCAGKIVEFEGKKYRLEEIK